MEAEQKPEVANASGTPSLEKENPAESGDHVEVVRTISRVPGNPHYYEKDGLRTYGDDEDHDHEPPVRIALVAPGKEVVADKSLPDEHPPVDVADCHGLPMDRITDSTVLVWCVRLLPSDSHQLSDTSAIQVVFHPISTVTLVVPTDGSGLFWQISSH